MTRIQVTIEVYEDEIKAESGLESLDEAIDCELNSLHDRGMGVDTWDYMDRPSRFRRNDFA